MGQMAEIPSMRVVEDDALSMWKETVHDFMDNEIGVEYCRDCYENREYPHKLFDGIVKNEWIGLQVPEAYGGQGGTHLEQAIMMEAVGKYGYDFGAAVATTTFTYHNILEHGTEEQINRFVVPMLSGDRRFSIGVTEPEAGTDAASLQTRAEKEGDHYVINGEKIFQSAAHLKNNVINLYVRTDPDAEKHKGISVLLVPNDLEGIEMTKLPTIVRKATGTNHVFFDDVHVPAENLLGEEGQGWDILTSHFSVERAQIAAMAVGNAQTVVDTALTHSQEREQFGRPISKFQVIKHRLADMQTEVDAARLLVYHTASQLDEGNDPRRLAAQAKLKASETFQDVAQEGMQIMGGAAMLPENDMQRYWRESKIAVIGGGTSEIQRSIISSELLKSN